MKALILGGIAWNTMVCLDDLPARRSHTVFARGSRDAIGSTGAVKAMNLRLLGADVTLWGLIGDDTNGERIRTALEAGDVDSYQSSIHLALRGTST